MKEHLDPVTKSFNAGDVCREAHTVGSCAPRLELAMKHRACTIGAHEKRCGTGPIRGTGPRIDVLGRGCLVKQPGIEAVTPENESELTGKTSIDRLVPGGKPQSPNARGVREPSDTAERRHTVRQQSLSAGLQPRVHRLLVEHDLDTPPAEYYRKRGARRTPSDDRDIGLSPHHDSVSISAEKPGPRAIMRPRSPWLGRPDATRSLSMNRTDALDWLP